MLGISFRSAAEIELQEAYEWYEEHSRGLGADLLRCVDACVQLIRRHPEIFPTVHREVRQGVVRRFPYSVLSVVSNDSIVVVSVFHSSRDPSIWRSRT